MTKNESTAPVPPPACIHGVSIYGVCDRCDSPVPQSLTVNAAPQAAPAVASGLSCDGCRKWIAANIRGGWIDDLRNKAEALEIRLADSAAPAGEFANLIAEFEAATSSCTRYHTEYMGKAMPDDVYDRFATLRDETIPRLRAALSAALAAAAPAGEPSLKDVANLIMRDACESEEADPEEPETICIDMGDLRRIVERHLSPSLAHGKPWKDAQEVYDVMRHIDASWNAYGRTREGAVAIALTAVDQLFRAAATKPEPASASPAPRNELHAIMERNEWRAAMVGLCQGPEPATVEEATRHLRDRLKSKACAPAPARKVSDERKAFEADWVKRHALIPMNTRTRDDGCYGDTSIQGEWEAWQARAVLALTEGAPIDQIEDVRTVNGQDL